MEPTALFLLVLAIYLWLVASYIDIRYKILPDAIHLTHISLALIFHLFAYEDGLSVSSMLLGAVAAGGGLLILALIFDAIYGRDTLGLGDVKLFFAAGFWLGFPQTLHALSMGAFFASVSIIFFMIKNKIRHKKKNGSLLTMEIPAGPGFIMGILIMLYMEYGVIIF
jgi:leader peptidase (prepilin peptidase)/N-methyltransferase